MLYYKKIDSPVGKITILCDNKNLLGLWIEGQSGGKKYNFEEAIQMDNPIIELTEHWLNRYFLLENPDLNEIPFRLEGSPFQLKVWEELCRIPYGKVKTYKEIALNVAKKMNKERMSAQAVGGAVGRNPISIIIPCHRVIGSNGAMVGYNGGIAIKEKLLSLEKQNLS